MKKIINLIFILGIFLFPLISATTISDLNLTIPKIYSGYYNFTENSPYLSFDGSTISFDLSLLNDTYDGRYLTTGNYVNLTQLLSFSYYNSTTLTTNSQLLNGNNYWNNTFATFNKTYADTIYYGINNPNGYYNITNFNISNYALLTTLNNGTYTYNWNSTGLIKNWSYMDTLLVNGNITANWFNGLFNFTTNDYFSFNGYNLTFNQSKLETIYYNATNISLIAGTPSGTIANIQNYNENSYNITEQSGANGLDFRVNFTDIIDFNSLVIRYKSSASESHLINIQFWNYITNSWENYGSLSQFGTYEMKVLGIYDADSHISGGVVQLRFLSNNLGNINHIHYFDWIQISKGYGTPSGQEIDPYWNSEKFNYYNTTQVDSINTSMKNYVDSTFLTEETNWNANYSNYLTLFNWNKTYADTLYYPLTTNPSNYLIWANAINGTLALSSDLSNYATLSYLTSAHYNKTEIQAINTSMKNYADSTFLTSYTETDPTWNANIGNVAFENQSNTFIGNQNITAGDLSIDSSSKFCLAQDCSHYIYYNGTSTIIH